MSLPETWEYSPLDSVAHAEMGQSPPSNTYNEEGKGLPFFQGKAEFGKLYPKARKWCSVPNKIAEPNDILLSIRAPVGPTNLALERCCIGRGLAAIRAIPPLDQKYLLYHFRNIESWLSQQGTGSTFTAISGGFVRELSVPIAPANEQKRVADKLDNLLGRVDVCREHLDRVPQILKRFRQSVLAAATSGELTKYWRNVNESTLNENVFLLADYIKELKTGPFGSSMHKSDYIEGGIPVVNPMHINNGKITPSAEMAVSKNKADELSDFLLCTGDVIIARRGVMGRCAVVTEKEDGWLCGTGSMVLRPTDDLHPAYLQIFLSSPDTVAALEAESVGSTMVNLNQKILLGLSIKVPPVNEQCEIIRIIDALFSYADRMEERYKAALASVERLTPSILDKAFRGELVPQDPTDEPASELLKRIQSARADTPKPARAKRTKQLSLSGEASTKPTITGHAILIAEPPTSHGRGVVQIDRNHPDVKGKPYLTGILKRIGGSVDAKYLYDQSGLDLVDFYKQLYEEVESGLIKGDHYRLEVA